MAVNPPSMIAFSADFASNGDPARPGAEVVSVSDLLLD